MLPNVITTPGIFATDLMRICAEHPVKMIAIGFFCGLMTEAVLYLAGEAHQALCAYRDLIKVS